MKRRMRRAAVLFALGVIVMLGGLVSNMPAVGIGGFVVMVAALALALSSWKRLGTSGNQGLRAVGSDAPARTRRKKSSTPAGGSFLSRLEERWQRRWDERDR